jgi:zinc protease
MLDRKTPPPFVYSTSFDLIKPVTSRLPNNIDVFFIHGGEQEVIKIELVFKAGRWFEQIAGVSYFTSNLLTKGTTAKTSFEISRIFELYGAHIEIQPGLDFVSVSVYSLTQHIQPVLQLLFEILHSATFPEKELEQHKAIYIQNLKVNLEKTNFLASKAFRKSLFGENHPYGKELDESDVSELSQNQLKDHFSRFFKETTIFVSGKFDDKVQRTINDLFSTWTFVPAENVGRESTTPNIGYVHLEKEDSVQSSIRVGRKSIQRHHADYAKVIFVGHVLGGYFGSRLMKNIREEKGLTYGIYSSVYPLKHDSYMVIGADVNKENIDLTRDEIHKELKRLRTEKISVDELETARNHFIGGLQSEITTPFAHADKIKSIYLFNLPANYYQQMINQINTITPSQIAETAERYFTEQGLTEVAAG